MATSTEHQDRPARPSIPTTPLFAVVGVTDLAVQQVRAAAASASSLQQQFRSDVEARLVALDPKTLKAQAEQAPNRAVAKALEVAVKAEAAYEELARRGKDLVERVYPPSATPTFRDQAGSTLNRGRAAVTDTASAIRGTLSLGRSGAVPSVPAPEAAPPLNLKAVQEAVAVGDGGNQKPAVSRNRPAAKKTTVRKSAVKATGTRKPPTSAPRAAKSAAKKVGE
jgi:hypothetical protein